MATTDGISQRWDVDIGLVQDTFYVVQSRIHS